MRRENISKCDIQYMDVFNILWDWKSVTEGLNDKSSTQQMNFLKCLHLVCAITPRGKQRRKRGKEGKNEGHRDPGRRDPDQTRGSRPGLPPFDLLQSLGHPRHTVGLNTHGTLTERQEALASRIMDSRQLWRPPGQAAKPGTRCWFSQCSFDVNITKTLCFK